ncbi:Ni/Fe hydrogenase subunit alpha [candidate division WOR-3 bacterium JGI_Cruoil_03_44_89]|uniref:Ni/Fe hydrogenase subunit alpha n=1 Tax=candidate division WOR-3 bacterium JGI_Cruoil_03_44_89 TaxID=1973748 RepID=A0A235BWQ5_UNCW3|nr:MAG: Ni/Fe hydrogenase subunit alpha [candidate division WOR-3 bacterium JGI_Cruoil_03_44_89]
MRRITIDPITRLEGHGKIEIFLNDAGNVDRAFFQVPELRGFEKFCEGRAVEEMPRITSRICGVCPTAHHMAATKALDDLFQVEPTPPARKIRELMYSAFVIEDHMLHFFFLGAPDFIVGLDAPASQRNILGVISQVGLEIGKKIIEGRKRCREILKLIGGKPVCPVCGLPGGVSKALKEEDRAGIKESANYLIEVAQLALKLFDDRVIKNKKYLDLISGDVYKHRTYYMGLVDAQNRVNFYDGNVRVIDPDGEEFVKFNGHDYLSHIEEHVEPWSYTKFSSLKAIGWKGFIDGKESGVFRVAPLARLNVADGMATSLAQGAYEKMYDVLGSKPVHNTLAFHWARLIEMLYGAERMLELAEDPELTDPDVRNIPTEAPDEGIGVVEAPRGTLIHHYKTDERGILTDVNLIVATQNNAAAICMSVERAAKLLINHGEVSDRLLNMVEMAFRAYDPCLACATHSLPGKMPLEIKIRNKDGEVIKTLRR